VRSLKRARERARQCRREIGRGKENLFDRVIKYLDDRHQVEIIPTNADFLQNGHALLKPSEGCLYYDKKYDDHPVRRLEVILHELGHLELHDRLKRLCSEPDPVYGSIYASDGAGTLARYNPRSVEEAEANAFVAEFLCEQEEVFRLWQGQPAADSKLIADHFGVAIHTVHTQLAEALYWIACGVQDKSLKKSGIEHDRVTRRFGSIDYDESQLAAARFTGAPALVDAGPGTGKTATLVKRIEFLLEDYQADPESLLVLTFSNEAAQELLDRVADKFGENVAARIRVSTFHGFGVSFLHHHGQFAGVDASALLIDEVGQEELVNSIIGGVRCEKLIRLKNPAEGIREIVRHINYLKNRLYDPESLSDELERREGDFSGHDDRDRGPSRQFLELFRVYEREKSAEQRLDFADLIALPVRILGNEPALAARYREKYRWVMVDEYQDVGRSVATLLRHLCGPNNPPWVVGDSRQAIYRFLGAAAENVEEFEKDFPDGVRFRLNVNYRSSPEIIGVANQLASLINGHTEGERGRSWCAAASNPRSIGPTPVSIAIADSDLAEQEGIAAVVKGWINQGISPGDVAILARRNIDVRDLVLALGRLGIKAITSGLATPEGAAGDLACIATFDDTPRTSLPRLAFALGRGRFDQSTIDSVIRQFNETPGALDSGEDLLLPEQAIGWELIAEIRRACDGLLSTASDGDAYTKMCIFLFDASDYLRRIIDHPDQTERSLALVEIVTALSRAASWRMAHPGLHPAPSRKGFGEYFRRSLNESAGGLIPPPAISDAVRVMTCHASKGLEFQCVAVVGQTLSRAPQLYQWLPPALQPADDEDIRQSDSLLFVSVTRAQGALVISFAGTHSGTPRSRGREVTPLFSRWQNIHGSSAIDIPQLAVERERAVLTTIWGEAPGRVIGAHSLDRDRCSIRTYLAELLGMRFPLNHRPIYPNFFQSVRRALERISHEFGREWDRLTDSQAHEIFLKEWEDHRIGDHPHHQIYLRLGQQYIERFARAAQSLPPVWEHIDTTVGGQQIDRLLRLNLVAFYRTIEGRVIAISFRPESFAAKATEGNLPWSSLDSAFRIPFVLLREREPQLHPYIFSGEDGLIYRFVWSKRKDSLGEEMRRAIEKFGQLSQGVFVEQVDRWKCDRCESRVICPYWLRR
jgi:superfamily I DNA/RNA helicase